MKSFFPALLILAVLLPMGCEDDVDYVALKQQEDRYFDLYMEANYPDLQSTESGLYYISYKDGTGISPDTGDYVLINYVAYTIPDETVVDTYDKEWAEDNDLYVDGVLYGPYKYKHGTEVTGMLEGVSKMKEGGIARLIFKSDLGYGADGLGQLIGPYESIMYDIQLLEVIKDPAEDEWNKIQNYLSQVSSYVRIYDEETDADMYYIPGTTGEGDLLSDDDEIEVYYKGSLLDGRVFDSNIGESSGLSITVGAGDMISGWDVGLKYFRYGSSGRLLIPHPLAYGEDGSTVSGTAKTSIPPYEALLFDITVQPQDTTDVK